MPVVVDAVPVKPENIKTNDTGIKLDTMLGGNNIIEGSDPSIEAKTVSSGAAYEKLRQTATNELLGVYSIDLSAGGKAVHDDFGTIDITFPVPADYKNSTVRVHHLHEDGSISVESAEVADGGASVTVTDLSTFALESVPDVASSSSSASTSGKDSTKKPAPTSTAQPSGKVGSGLTAAGDDAYILLGVLVVALLVCGSALAMFARLSRKRQ